MKIQPHKLYVCFFGFIALCLDSCAGDLGVDLTAASLDDFSQAEWQLQVDDNEPSQEASSPALKAVEGLVDMTHLVNGTQTKLIYASRVFESQGGEHIFTFGSSLAMQVWINDILSVEIPEARHLDENEAEVRLVLKRGTNHIRIKLWQENDADYEASPVQWAFASKLTKMDAEEASPNAVDRVRLTIAFPQAAIEPGEMLNFNVSTVPALAVSLPFNFELSDLDGKVLASGQRLTDIDWALELKYTKPELLKLSISPASSMDKTFLAKLGTSSFFQYYSLGEIALIRRDLASKALAAAATLSASQDPGDIATSLLFLAERLQETLHPNLMRDHLMLGALRDTAEYLGAIKKGGNALSSLRGHRQMAYRSAIDDSLQPYSILLPQNYDSAKKYKLLAILHGKEWDDYIDVLLMAPIAPEDFIVIGILGRGDLMYKGLAEQDALDVIDRVTNRYTIDPDKIYLRGGSMGGFGAWHLAQSYPDRFAGIAVFDGYTGLDFIPNTINVPTLVVHGVEDILVPISMVQEAAALQKKLGGIVDYQALANVGHNAWEAWLGTHGNQKLFDYFRDLSRNKSPTSISAVIPSSRYGKHYWLRVIDLDRSGPLLTPRVTQEKRFDKVDDLVFPAPGRIEAKRISQTEVSISSERIRAFVIDTKLAGLSQTSKLKIDLDGLIFDSINPAPSLSFSKNQAGSWSLAADIQLDRLTHSGVGFADLFLKPLIIVYGTKNKARAAYFEAAARRLADWSLDENTVIGTAIGRFIVKSDTQLSQEDLVKYNLLLLGDASENHVAAQYPSLLSPYWNNKAITVGGQTFNQNGMGLILPNPQIPSRLIAFMLLPEGFTKTLPTDMSWFKLFTYRFRHARLTEADSWPAMTPDLMVFSQNAMRDKWSGWFDYQWQNLEERSDK